jgi:hypothetical protein
MNGTETRTTTYVYREEGYSQDFEAFDDQGALAIAEDMLRSGDYGTIEKTIRIRASVARPDVDEDSEPDEYDLGTITVTLEPDEPKCSAAGGHDWADGGARGELPVVGSGGGVKITEHCRHCNVTKVWDQWDTDPYNGSVMATTRYVSAP